TVESSDADTRAVIDHLKSRHDCTGQIGALGICLGGHLAFRAAMNSDVLATACFYATDIHKGSLGKGMNDDSLLRAKDIKGELLMIWGRQDPHIPLEGRMTVLARLNEVNAKFSWHEGIRYDPELAYQLYGLVFDFFHRRLGFGDLPAQVAGAGETKH